MTFEATPPAAFAPLIKQMFDHVRLAEAGIYEGGASLAQVASLSDTARRAGATRIAEIGFNVGYSTIGFLQSSPDVTVVSFELDHRSCVKLAKEFIDELYPGRHELVLGDSVQTVAEYADAHASPANRFDLVFIDGGHEYEVASADIRNARRIAAPGAVVVMDDLTPWYLWGTGPDRAWREAVSAGLVEPVEYLVDGERVESIEGPADRAWVVGRFC